MTGKNSPNEESAVDKDLDSTNRITYSGGIEQPLFTSSHSQQSSPDGKLKKQLNEMIGKIQKKLFQKEKSGL